MKILISTDIEGVAGVTHAEQTRSGNPEYERARVWMTEEANSAIRGAFAGGATEVLVNDSHGGFRNLLLDRLDARAQTITGKPRYLGMMAGVEQDCDAVYLVGYHARSQTAGVLAHTINSFAFRTVRVNGTELGEAGLYGALAGDLGVPVGLFSGDDVSRCDRCRNQARIWERGVHEPRTVGRVRADRRGGSNRGVQRAGLAAVHDRRAAGMRADHPDAGPGGLVLPVAGDAADRG